MDGVAYNNALLAALQRQIAALSAQLAQAEAKVMVLEVEHCEAKSEVEDDQPGPGA
jgi:hypothetical protein